MISRTVPKPVSFATAREFVAYSEGGHSAFWMINGHTGNYAERARFGRPLSQNLSSTDGQRTGIPSG